MIVGPCAEHTVEGLYVLRKYDLDAIEVDCIDGGGTAASRSASWRPAMHARCAWHLR